MNAFDVKMEKANAMLRYRRLQKITTLFRFIEMFVFLIMISRVSTQLIPFPVKVSGDYFRGISFASLSPKFVFVIGNAIILILFVKSRFARNGDGQGKVDFYEEYVRSCERTVNSTIPTTTAAIVPGKERKICRSQSENVMGEKHEEHQSHRKLRRSVTERRRLKNFDCGWCETAEEKRYAEDELSSEEFRRTVEAFIARQQKSLRDEEFSPMVYLGG